MITLRKLRVMVDTDLIVLPMVDDMERVVERLRLAKVLNLLSTKVNG